LKQLLARERARAEFQDWEKKEEEVTILEPEKCNSVGVDMHLLFIYHFSFWNAVSF
jgi:hypothetical protein